MKKLLLAVSAGLITGSIAFAQGNVEKAIIDLENQWGKAILASDGKAIEPFLAPDFVGYGSDGAVIARAQFIANTNKIKWQVINFSDEKVHLHGNAAIYTGVVTGKGTGLDGKPFDIRERMVDTWLKMPDGKWKCVTVAGIPIK